MPEISFIGGLVFFILVVVGLSILVVKGCEHSIAQVDDEDRKMSVNIGKRILIGRDTFTIVDYSLLMSNYKLSNGLKVNRSFVDSSKPF